MLQKHHRRLTGLILRLSRGGSQPVNLTHAVVHAAKGRIAFLDRIEVFLLQITGPAEDVDHRGTLLGGLAKSDGPDSHIENPSHVIRLDAEESVRLDFAPIRKNV